MVTGQSKAHISVLKISFKIFNHNTAKCSEKVKAETDASKKEVSHKLIIMLKQAMQYYVCMCDQRMLNVADYNTYSIHKGTKSV